MLHSSHNIVTAVSMSIGNSGRIVIEVDPGVKRHLYAALTRDGMSLKEWFLRNAQTYLAHADQWPLSPAADELAIDEKKIIELQSTGELGKNL